MERYVLLVDDDGSLTDGLRRRLHAQPFRVLCANSGEEALQRMVEQTVDVVVSDEQMPGMSGVDLLTEVRRRWPETVTLMLSGRASAGTVVRALNQGQIYRFLIKPCGTETLAAEIREALVHKLVMDRCRELLPICRRMQQLLASIEARHPGVVAEATRQGARSVVIRRDDFQGMEDLAERLAVEIHRSGDYLPTSEPAGGDGETLVPGTARGMPISSR
jgi:DNA-binding response OmpR family regulator